MLSAELLAQIRHIHIKGRYLANEVFSGEYVSAFRGRGIEFEEVREYQPGDEIRDIDWNVTARMGKPFVKVFREERERTVMLLLDVSASLHFGVSVLKKDYLAELAAVLASAATNSNDKVGLALFSSHLERLVPPRKGRAHVWNLIQTLLDFKPRGTTTNLKAVLQWLSRTLRKRCIVFILSDFLAADFERDFRIVARRHDVVSLVIGDPAEEVLPSLGELMVVDSEAGVQRHLHLGAGVLSYALAQRQRERSAKLRRFFIQNNVDHLFLSTGQDMIKPLMELFALREHRH